MLTLQLGNIVALPHNWLLQADLYISKNYIFI